MKEAARHLCQQLADGAAGAAGAASVPAFAPYVQAAEQKPGHGTDAGQTPEA